MTNEARAPTTVPIAPAAWGDMMGAKNALAAIVTTVATPQTIHVIERVTSDAPLAEATICASMRPTLAASMRPIPSPRSANCSAKQTLQPRQYHPQRRSP